MKRITSFLMALFLATTALWAAFTPAAFTVSSEGKQVYFSQGNLQCTGVTSGNYTWSFAENQYDMLGEANVSAGDLANKIDLFGWSGNTETAKWGISTSKDYADYTGDFVDWGTNTIGTYAPNTYRTLTNDEWKYLLNTRTNASNLRGVARIKLNDDGTQYANGLILLPDSWTDLADVAFKSGFADSYGVDYYATYQTFTLDQWQKLEAAGAVFLPASGYRYGSGMNRVQDYGRYWSATAYGSDGAYCLYFGSGEAFAGNNNRYYGQAVRLVQDVKYAISLTQPEHGNIAADKTESVAGETITLTITPAVYYQLKEITVTYGEGEKATVTSDYTFTMPAGEVTITAEFEKVSSAFTPVAFTVSSEGKQVLFSQGNLQCAGVTSGNYTWSFADYQTEMLGEANVNGSALADKIDLFGWSTNNETTKWGISTSTDYNDYLGDFVDWGTNTIGTYAPNTYRTLTKDEWAYLLNTRPNASERKGVARITLSDTEYANGLILLPDDWTCPEGVTFKSGFASGWSIEAYATYQTFTLDQWQKLEAAGAVFLPASGCRDGSSMYNVQNRTYYWSATAYDSNRAYYLNFYADGADAGYNYYRYNGQAVRLVQDIKYAISLTQPEHGTIAADKTESVAGETITLTITPDTGYELEAITVKDAANEDIAVTNNTFTMPASNVTVSATFKKVNYTITIADGIANGKVTASATAQMDDEVTLTITPDTGYELDVLTVKDATGNPIAVEGNKFTMPASNVTVSATFKVKTATALATTQALDLRTENGRVICAQEFQIFDLLGRNVTRLNGSLNGVYIVKVGDKAQKVVVK